ncbi:DNA-binding protein [Hornefia porci]|uniref:DNA-binding protein n=1 Tax=Hornefia porci TaxID=2652292 RepID=A0A1Q9JKE3_9FIRM|nr:ORF6N domain-containing protein [Hornefia porci]OLR56690.1 DNA-binding protein [Hornefia porci]
MAKKGQEQTTDIIPAIAETKDIKSLIYVVRGQQVMLDSDLAMLYQVETKVFNQAVTRNIDRFPENFRFQLTKEEFDALRSQIATSNGRGGRRYRPYMFTEQGIAMLSGVLRSDVAIQVSIRIMNTFVEMRRFIANNALLFEKVSNIELKQLEYQKSTDEKFDKVFQYIEDHAESEQKVFFDGQIYDAFSLITTIIQKAQKEIILIDGYVDVDTLNILAKKNTGVDVKIYTFASAQLTNRDAANFNAQYPTLTVKKTQVFHDRFIILDGKTAYHVGASIKDAGKKCFGISLMEDPGVVTDLLNRLKTV